MGGGDFFRRQRLQSFIFIDNLNFGRKNFRFLFCGTVRHTTHNHGHLLRKHS